MKAKKWLTGVLTATFLLLAGMASYIITVDPFFHYHKPLSSLAYPMDNERYQNDGMIRNYEYDTIVIGTSMTSNFRISDCDSFFGGTSIKTPYKGASFKEINDNLERAVDRNPRLVRAIRCLDISNLLADKDYVSYEGIPNYLYDNNPFNDVRYILNKYVLIEVDNILSDTSAGKKPLDMDEYMNWQKEYSFGAQSVLATYDRPGKTEYHKELSKEEKEDVLANIRQNVTELAGKHPEITFYYYFSPYSICWWDTDVNRTGKMDWQIDLEQTVIEEILKSPNIKLFSFEDDFELTCDLNQYKDRIHYGEATNTLILKRMSENKNQLTRENYKDYLQKIYDFYSGYDYDSLYS